MKIFIYKSLVICVLAFVMFHLTLGYTIKSYKNKIFNTFSKDKIVFLKEQTRNEINLYFLYHETYPMRQQPKLHQNR